MRTARRPRDTRTSKGAVPVFAEVAQEAKDVLDGAAAATGAPKWAVLEWILLHAEVDEHGRPLGWPQVTSEQEELPLQQSA